MWRYLLALASIAVGVTLASAQQIPIVKQHHVGNVGNGYCGYCCIETIGKHYGYKQVDDLVSTLYEDWGDWGGWMYDTQVCDLLDKYDIAHKRFYVATADDLAQTCEAKHLSIARIVVPGMLCQHYVTVIGVYKNHIVVVDPNKPGHFVWYPRSLFMTRWTGALIVVYPKNE